MACQPVVLIAGVARPLWRERGVSARPFQRLETPASGSCILWETISIWVNTLLAMLAGAERLECHLVGVTLHYGPEEGNVPGYGLVARGIRSLTCWRRCEPQREAGGYVTDTAIARTWCY